MYLCHHFPQIAGEFSNVQDALYNATGRLRDHLFVSTQNSVRASPYGRMRDPVPLGGQPVVGVAHSLNRHSLSQSMDNLTLSRNSDHPSSPGLWAPKVYHFLSVGWFSFPIFPLLYD